MVIAGVTQTLFVQVLSEEQMGQQSVREQTSAPENVTPVGAVHGDPEPAGKKTHIVKIYCLPERRSNIFFLLLFQTCDEGRNHSDAPGGRTERPNVEARIWLINVQTVDHYFQHTSTLLKLTSCAIIVR